MIRSLGLVLLVVMSTTVRAEAEQGAASMFGKELLELRDPFRRPSLVWGETVPLSELEIHPLHQYSLVGVMTGPNRLRGMVRGPDGKTHFVSENDKIGNKQGFIKSITPTGLTVQEHMVNVLGEEEVTLTEIRVTDREVR